MKCFVKTYFLYGKRVSCSEGCDFLHFQKSDTISFTKIRINFSALILKILILISGLGFLSSSVYSQENPPTFKPALVNEPPSGDLGSLNRPEIVGCQTIMTFSVPAVTDPAVVGVKEHNTFTWKVFGGRILTPTGAANGHEVYEGKNYETSEIVLNGWNDDDCSEITIEWENQENPYGFIAVKQCSEYGCTDEPWTIYYISTERGVDDFFIKLVSVDNVCPLDNLVVEIEIKGGDNWSFILNQNDDKHIPINNLTPTSSGVTSLGLIDGKETYKYVISIPTTMDDIGSNKFRLSNFEIVLPDGGNITTGTISDPIEIFGTVYQPPTTSPIQHN